VFADVFERLREQHGPQEGWWPAESRFEVMVGALLVQRTTWRNAAVAIERLKQVRCMTAERLAHIETDELRTLIKPAGFFRVKAIRLKKLARFVISAGGLDSLSGRQTVELRNRLLELEGVGPETADAMLGYVFDRPVLVVDAYTRRLFARLRHPSPALSDTDLKRDAEATLGTTQALNEFHALVIAHGQRCCSPTPSCEPCSLRAICGFEREGQSGLA
jgi:endonuclease-3 related protein